MSRKLAALLGALVLCLTTIAPAVARPTAPGATSAPTLAAPASAVDQTKVPHYFGPYPNWANSPMTAADATVAITGNGTGATASASVDATGVITGITILTPGSGYTTATVGDHRLRHRRLRGCGPSGVRRRHRGVRRCCGWRLPASGRRVLRWSARRDRDRVRWRDALTLDNAGSGYHVPTVAFDLPNDPNGTMPTAHVLCTGDTEGSPPYCTGTPNPDGTPGEVTITSVVLDTPGSGYTDAPGVAILDGTQFDPIRPGGTGALVSSTLLVQSVTLDTFGSYVGTAGVAITDSLGGTGTGALASATTSFGAVTGIANLVGGTGYITAGGIKKFVDALPGLTPAGANLLGQYIPVAVPDTTTFPGTDYYVIGVMQHRERMSSSLPAAGTLLREYVQLSTSVVPGKQVRPPDGHARWAGRSDPDAQWQPGARRR